MSSTTAHTSPCSYLYLFSPTLSWPGEQTSSILTCYLGVLLQILQSFRNLNASERQTDRQRSSLRDIIGHFHLLDSSRATGWARRCHLTALRTFYLEASGSKVTCQNLCLSWSLYFVSQTGILEVRCKVSTFMVLAIIPCSGTAPWMPRHPRAATLLTGKSTRWQCFYSCPSSTALLKRRECLCFQGIHNGWHYFGFCGCFIMVT